MPDENPRGLTYEKAVELGGELLKQGAGRITMEPLRGGERFYVDALFWDTGGRTTDTFADIEAVAERYGLTSYFGGEVRVTCR